MIELCVNYLTVLKKKVNLLWQGVALGQQTTIQVITLSHF